MMSTIQCCGHSLILYRSVMSNRLSRILSRYTLAVVHEGGRVHHFLLVPGDQAGQHSPLDPSFQVSGSGFRPNLRSLETTVLGTPPPGTNYTRLRRNLYRSSRLLELNGAGLPWKLPNGPLHPPSYRTSSRGRSSNLRRGLLSGFYV